MANFSSLGSPFLHHAELSGYYFLGHLCLEHLCDVNTPEGPEAEYMIECTIPSRRPHTNMCSTTNNKIKSHLRSLWHNKIPHVKMRIYFKPWKVLTICLSG